MSPPSREDLFNLPNLLSLVRMGSIPLLVLFMYLPGQAWTWAAAALFFVAGLTDLLDGFMARRMKKVTVLGQFLDPVADKLLVTSLLVILAALGRVPGWLTLVIICREIAVTGLRAVAATQGFSVPSDRWGKSKTALQMLAVLLLLLHYPIGAFDPHFWGMVVLWLAAITTAISGLNYFRRFKRQLG